MTQIKRVICDLDGTLANLDHRLPLIKKEKPEWESFFEQSVTDIPNQWCVDLLSALFNSGYTVEIVSGRPFDDTTKNWLETHGIKYHALWLLGDRKTPDHILKMEWLRNQITKENIAFVIDDRQKVVDMWREEGLVCLQCNSWEEYKRDYGPREK
jgi:phosphoglycolate phosphatase-like HAD superfamily hydrolase